MDHVHYMQRCLQLAEKGLGYSAPNPIVGCVIVHNSKIIGEGYHAKYGSHHAEVNAVNSVKDKSLLSKSILYVTLEPCSHFGKTPPCTDLIIKYKIPEVIIGNKDPFEKVNGSGIKKLKDAGIKIMMGILEKECRFMNRRFFVFQEQKRPYIILKWAQSKDGFIAPDKKSFVKTQTMTEKIHRVSNEYSHLLVHKWRSEEAAIMVGTNTARSDNPRLTVRNLKGKNPVRVVIDKNLMLNSALHLFDKKTRTLVYTSKNKDSSNNLEFVKINFGEDVLKQVTDHLYEQHIQSVIVEGGTILLRAFIENNLWDEARIFSSDSLLNSGVIAPEISGKILYTRKIEKDTLTVFMH
ncbi:MAG TPA: bifunctional diaminohydroxyphosphoribosylaminopyrimidine deaminase/5-amino-6-(5-phosphoribosylamino)uracil reductase RibD [Bacteroidia bacterium]|nr:bifunctional diaminohydroxyphosphoribosylaminopyrimidine deaminase/5-amino-6-(5-phosphoribosylamino)uracil reductase RibD [Bacteroidia bacterium]